MGSRMALKLMDAGHSVAVYNRSAEKAQALIAQGVCHAATPKEAAQDADIVISMVTDDNASKQVWLQPETGAVWGLREDAIAIESSTLTVSWTKELADKIAAHSAIFLDAPVVGSRPQAEAGKLIYLVGGEANTVAQIQPILLTVGELLHHVGSVGQGMAMKLAVNALFGIQVAALAEVLGMLDQQGITAPNSIKCLSNLPVLSLAARGAGSLMVTGNHEPLFPIDLVEKDFRYASETGQAVRADISLVTATQQIFQQAIAQGYGADNVTGVAKLFFDGATS